jgi:hypothetical protein
MADSKEYRHNHYVPVWYQRRFLPPGATELYRLDLSPDPIRTPRRVIVPNGLKRLGPNYIFAQDDLYTTKFGSLESTDMEKLFFGAIDREGKKAVDFFARFWLHKEISEEPTKKLEDMLRYMTVQKLRTPKGLAWLMLLNRSHSRNRILKSVVAWQELFCAIWTEAVWQIADASRSETKFIVSDHPVVVYNRACLPLSKYCRGAMDPDIRMAASHTYFPLSPERILILTNLNWVRNPYQPELRLRPNPDFFRGAIFNLMSVQTHRFLSETEVRQINLVTKKRASRFIAAGKEDWLYPERYLSQDEQNWRRLGRGWLLMPDPRNEYMGGEVIFGFDDGHAEGFGPYGHRPWEKGYEDASRERSESGALDRFKAEFARHVGPNYRSVSADMGNWDLRHNSDSPEMHAEHLKEAKAYARGARRTRGKRHS